MKKIEFGYGLCVGIDVGNAVADVQIGGDNWTLDGVLQYAKDHVFLKKNVGKFEKIVRATLWQRTFVDNVAYNDNEIAVFSVKDVGDGWKIDLDDPIAMEEV